MRRHRGGGELFNQTRGPHGEVRFMLAEQISERIRKIRSSPGHAGPYSQRNLYITSFRERGFGSSRFKLQ